MRRIVITALTMTTAVTLVPGFASAAPSSSVKSHPSHTGLRGIPSGAPPAAYRRSPRLPEPTHRQWPFGSNAFPRTSGTGRLHGGAAYWSDFVYDAYGAAPIRNANASNPNSVSTLAPTQGYYSYPSKQDHNDGADIFRAAVGLTRTATYWRVDWNTLTDKRVPIAEWTFDTDDRTGTGGSLWPAGADVHSRGIDKALVVSSKGAELISVETGKVLGHFRTAVNMRARSFIVRIPRRRMHVSHTWRIRLAAGLANGKGNRFAPAGNKGAGQPNIYNVTFRSVTQEPPIYVPTGDYGDGSGVGLLRGAKYGNYWMDAHQADALAHSNVSAFSMPVTWRLLAHHRSTPEPRPTGYSVRWYVTPLHLGQGIIANPTTEASGDLRPNYLGRVQPYSVYVPSNYTPSHRFALTWILHSLSVNYNQYGALDPAMIRQECEDRDSICATTEGFGPDGWYYDEAEVDFWDVWHALAQSYSLDPNRTVMSGYSMGGFASYKLGLSYPDLFAKSMPLAGPPGCGLRVAEGAGGGCNGHAGADGDTTPLIKNARWLPYILGDGVADELVPVSSVLQQVNTFLKLGYRIHFELYPAEDHLVYATQDGFSSEIAHLGRTERVRNPGHITYSWYPDLTVRKWGIGPTGDYWIRGLSARDSKPGVLATIDAVDGMRPSRHHVVKRRYHQQVPGDPSPALVINQSWKFSRKQPTRRHRLTLHLTNVKMLGIDIVRTRLRSGTIVVISDGATRVRLLDLPNGSRLRGHVARHHRITVRVGKGTTKLRLSA